MSGMLNAIVVPSNPMLGVRRVEVDSGWESLAAAIGCNYIEALPVHNPSPLYQFYRNTDMFGDADARIQQPPFESNTRAQWLAGWPARSLVGDVIILSVDQAGRSQSVHDELFEWLVSTNHTPIDN